MSAHTPGPLFVKQENKWPFSIRTVNFDGQEVFFEGRHAYGTCQKTVAEVMEGTCFKNSETRMAAVESNARQVADAYLRAAAPELLSALIALDEAFCLDGDTREERHQARLALISARAAIKKAIEEHP